MSLIVVDVESDGNCPVIYSMIFFGAVFVEDLNTTFYGKTKPISEHYCPDALKTSGFTRGEHLQFPDPMETMINFKNWIEIYSKGKPIFISDNPAFDWQFINYYFYRYIGNNPFGFSAKRIGDIYSGLVKNMFKGSNWKKLRKTKHSHNPVDDAKGNAEALLEMRKTMGLKF